ncbi:unnamed protein product [Spodoptera exigua]|nr:unnamed protein product [Spodoptera exigua]
MMSAIYPLTGILRLKKKEDQEDLVVHSPEDILDHMVPASVQMGHTSDKTDLKIFNGSMTTKGSLMVVGLGGNNKDQAGSSRDLHGVDLDLDGVVLDLDGDHKDHLGVKAKDRQIIMGHLGLDLALMVGLKTSMGLIMNNSDVHGFGSDNVVLLRDRRLARSLETADEREARLTAVREQIAETRRGECSTARQSRLDTMRTQNALSRSQESAEAHEMRLSIDRERHAKSRASETFTQRETRLSSQRNRTDVARSCESVEGRQARLESDRERHAESRASETYTQRETRLSSQRSRTDAARSCESVEARQIRLESDRERHADSRASETYTQREARLCLQRSRASFSRSIEDDEERETRLRRDRSQHALSRSLETDEQREERRAAARQRYHELLGDASTHLSQERDRIQEIRGTWSDEQRAAQVEQDRLRRNVNQLSTSDEESTVYDIEEQPWLNKEGSGFMYNVAINYAAYGNIGALEEVCAHCQARKWKGKPNGMCCASGKVRLDSMQDPPDLLRVLLNGEHPKSSHFLKNIRAYNSAFQTTSFGANQIVEAGFMPTFNVQGQVYHQIGSLLPTDKPKFLQVYFISDFDEQANVRSRHIPNLDSGLVRGLQILNVRIHMASVPENERNRFKFVISADRRPIAAHPGRYNAPTTNEVAVLLVDQECDKRDIVLRTHDDRLQRISETHRAYDSLQYPLMFCRGEDGYHFAHYNEDPQTGSLNYIKKTSAMQFYSFLIQLRFLVDMYAKIETERLVFIRSNQRKLRAENYVHLRDAMHHDANAQDVGRMVILPSTFTGGPRYMHERTQDAFCYVRKFGSLDMLTKKLHLK